MAESIVLLITFFFSFLLSTQFGKHFFLPFSYLSGIRIDYLAPTIYLADIITLLLLLIFGTQSIKQLIDNKHKWSKYISIGILFGIFFLTNFFFSLSQPIWLYRFAKLIQWTLILYIVKQNTQKKTFINALVYGLLFGSLLQLVLCIEQLVFRQSLQGLWYFFGERQFTISTPGIAKAFVFGKEILRPYGTFSHPNSLGGFYLLIYSYVLTTNRVKNLYLKTVLLFLSASLVIISFSKTAIIVFVLINTLYFFLQKNRCTLCLVSKLFFSFFLLTIVANTVSDPISLQKRFDFVYKSVQIIKEKPVFGVGMGSYLIAQSRFPSQYPVLFQQPVHNVILLAIAELGIPITLFIGWLFFINFFPILKKTQVLFPFIVIFLTGMNDHYWVTLQQNILLSAVIFGIIQYEQKTI